MAGNSLPFFAAEYENRRVSIRRTAEYDDMIHSLQRAFPSLSEIPASRISISQVFPELGAGAVEISREAWKDALAWVKTVQVIVSNPEPDTVSKKRKMESVETPGPASTSSNPIAPSLHPTVPNLNLPVAEAPAGSISARGDSAAANRANRSYGLRKVSMRSIVWDSDSDV
ncbi:hypothetical protein RSAG8_02981, partial [Rhizoctonia solani AG-8 WAC10335]